jgi:uncharacterized protein (DUF2267 family)
VELDARLRWHDLPRSYRLLSAVMHALDVDDRPGRPDEEERFLHRIEVGFLPDRIKAPDEAVRAVLEVMQDRTGAIDLVHLRQLLPRLTRNH